MANPFPGMNPYLESRRYWKEPNTKGRELYLRKQGEVLKSDVHLVEIDLLRGGEYTLAPPRGKVIERFGDRWHYLMRNGLR